MQDDFETLQALQDLHKVIKACKTEADAKRAGIVVEANEWQRKGREIDWSTLPVLVRSTADSLGLMGTIPCWIRQGGVKEPLPCYRCGRQIEIGMSYRIKDLYIVHEECVNGTQS